MAHTPGCFALDMPIELGPGSRWYYNTIGSAADVELPVMYSGYYHAILPAAASGDFASITVFSGGNKVLGVGPGWNDQALVVSYLNPRAFHLDCGKGEKRLLIRLQVGADQPILIQKVG